MAEFSAQLSEVNNEESTNQAVGQDSRDFFQFDAILGLLSTVFGSILRKIPIDAGDSIESLFIKRPRSNISHKLNLILLGLSDCLLKLEVSTSEVSIIIAGIQMSLL